MARAFASEIYFGEPLGLTVPDAARMPLCYRRKIPSAGAVRCDQSKSGKQLACCDVIIVPELIDSLIQCCRNSCAVTFWITRQSDPRGKGVIGSCAS